MSANISVNARAAALVERLIADAAELKIGVARGTSGETLIDCGATHGCSSVDCYCGAVNSTLCLLGQGNGAGRGSQQIQSAG